MKRASPTSEREADEFNEQAAKDHQKEIHIASCAAAIGTKPKRQPLFPRLPQLCPRCSATGRYGCGWSAQAHHASKGASLLIAADFTGFACPAIQQNFIKGRVTIVSCPKLDGHKQLVDKLADILKNN